MDVLPPPDAARARTVPLVAEPFDDYSVYVPAAPGDRYGVELRVQLYRPDAPGFLPRPDGQRVRVARNGVVATYTTRYVEASEVPAPPLRREAGAVLHD